MLGDPDHPFEQWVVTILALGQVSLVLILVLLPVIMAFGKSFLGW